MRPLVLAVPLLLAAACLAPGPAQASAPALGARLTGCEVGALAGQRGADFEASMPAVPGASALAMRFELERRRGAGAWRPVAGVPGFARYERSSAGAAGFVYAKRVERLVPGSSYRVLVRFRWSDAAGVVRRRATRRSPGCPQPELRPDLGVVGISTGDPSGDGRARYVVQVRNAGPTAVAGPVPVSLRVGAVLLPAGALAGLAPGALGSVTLEGPACRPGERLVAVVDPRDDVEEAGERDNARTVACPG